MGEAQWLKTSQEAITCSSSITGRRKMYILISHLLSCFLSKSHYSCKEGAFQRMTYENITPSLFLIGQSVNVSRSHLKLSDSSGLFASLTATDWHSELDETAL